MCWRYDGGSFGLFDSLEAWLDDSEALLSIFWWISWARGVTRDFGVNPPLIRRVISALDADLKIYLRLRKAEKSVGYHLKSSSDQSHFLLKINVGKSRFRYRTTLNLNDVICNRFWVGLKIQFKSRSMSDPTNSDIDFKN